jgi:Protein of unknown function (DUF1203)
MTFQIHALPKAPFADLFALPDADLHRQGMRRVIADTKPGFPCRVSLQDAEIGEELLLLNYTHLDGSTPYAASHAIYVRKDATQAQPMPDAVPDVLAMRLLSVRAFDSDNLMVAADVTDGKSLSTLLNRFFSNGSVAVIHVHNAKQGCFAARVTRS